MTAGKAESLFDQLSLGYTEWGVVPISVNLRSNGGEDREGAPAERRGTAGRRGVIGEGHRGWWPRRAPGVQVKGRALGGRRGRKPRSSTRDLAGGQEGRDERTSSR